MYSRILLSLAFCVIVGVIPGPRVGQAQNLETAAEFWQAEQERQWSRQSRGYYRYNAEPEWPSHNWGRHNDDPTRGTRERSFSRQPPQVEVKSPQYYIYQPDKPEWVRLDELCEVEIVANDPRAVPEAPLSLPAICAHLPSFGLRVLPEIARALRVHYAKRPHFLWVKATQASSRAMDAIAALARSGRFGLSPSDYLVAPPGSDSVTREDQMKALVSFEFTLSARILRYVLDATRGRIDPNRISGYHHIRRKVVDLSEVLNEVAQATDVTAYLEARHPDSPQFRDLVAELERQLARQPGPSVKRRALPGDILIRPGERHQHLAEAITAISRAGSEALKRKHAETIAQLERPGKYSRALVTFVRDFQREKGMRVDGIIGPNTIESAKIESATEKIEKLRLAIERLRWLPRDLGERYVFLNQPAFTVTYLEKGKAPLSMRAIIGKESSQTYFFVDQIRSIEYNPYWGVPRSIMINEMLPKLSRDPSYLDRLGYEVISASGTLVPSSSVDWYAVARNRSSVRVRQPPGKSNALGQLKISFPNKHAIYLHDTPHKELFKKSRRTFSHGCVRLQYPRAMAAALLGATLDYIDSRIADGETVSEPVKTDIPVYLAYFTAWPDLDGNVHYYPDVYERDAHLRGALQRTAALRSTN